MSFTGYARLYCFATYLASHLNHWTIMISLQNLNNFT